MSHPRGVVWSLEPLKKALRKREGYPTYFLAPFNLEGYWWGPQAPKTVKPGIIHKLVLNRWSFYRTHALHQLRLNTFYMDTITFNEDSGPPTVKCANSGWFYQDHYKKNRPAVYLFENYWFAFAYVQKLGLDK